MTTADATTEIVRLRADVEWLREANSDLARETRQLRAVLDEVAPYDLSEDVLGEKLHARRRDRRFALATRRGALPVALQPAADVLAELDVLLPGWPAARWYALARLIENREAASRATSCASE